LLEIEYRRIKGFCDFKNWQKFISFFMPIILASLSQFDEKEEVMGKIQK
jgi:hypothetical protein